MSQQLPAAEVFAVTLGGNVPQCLGRVTVRCPYCVQLHAHRVFNNDAIEFTRTAPCTGDRPVLRYRIDLTAGSDRDDNAIDESVPNWTE